MTCLLPPPLDDDQLLAALAGTAPPAVQQHLEQCPFCRDRLAELQGWRSWLAQNLYRTPCPSSLELGEYRLKMLSKEESARIEAHLTWCPGCRSELELFGDQEQGLALDSLVDPLEQLVEQVRVVVARLRDGLAGMQPQTSAPALAGMRGQETTRSLTYDADGLAISLLIQADPAQPAKSVLLGLVSGDESDQLLEAHLWQGVEQIASTSVDQLGNFAFPPLPSAQYDLILRSDTYDIVIQRIDL
jgi:hypothetical protein